MGLFDSIAGAVMAPFNTATQALGGFWDDYTGKTATAMSVNAAKQNTASQIAWERERATNAHQWEIEDLEKAGLNPILSAGGSGAATGGISPQMPDTSAYKGMGAIIPLISTLANTKATIASANKAENEAKLIGEQTLTERINQLVQSAKEKNINEDTLGKQVIRLINEERRKQAEIDTNWYEPEKILNFTTKAIGPIIEVLKAFGYFGLANKLMKGNKLPGEKGYGKSQQIGTQNNNYYNHYGNL